MRIRIATLLSITFIAISTLSAQVSDKLEMTFDPVDRQDSLGLKFIDFLKQYEDLGHLNAPGRTNVSNGYLNKLKKLFKNDAKVPNDLKKSKTITGTLSISEYIKLAQTAGYQEYTLVLEAKDISVVRSNSQEMFKTKINLLKIFENRAASGRPYKNAAIYQLEVEMSWNLDSIIIYNINYFPEKQYSKFQLGNVGYIKNSEVATSHKLEGLIQEIIDTRPPKAKSNIVFTGSYLLTDFLSPVNYSNNLSNNTTMGGDEWGWSAGIHLELPITRNGSVRWLIGAKYEVVNYSLNMDNMYFTYDTDEDGYPLEDLEGTLYDTKHVGVSNFNESGNIAYLNPETGVLFQFMLTKKLGLGINTVLGYSYPLTSEFATRTTVSYRGEKDGFPPISGDHLGFYTDLEKDVTSTFSNARPFLSYRVGASLDLHLNEKTALTFGFDYKKSFNAAIVAGGDQFHYLDPENDGHFESNFNNLSEEIFYKSIVLSLGLKLKMGTNKE